MAVVTAPEDAERAVRVLRASRYGQDAAIIGEAADTADGRNPALICRTPVGGERVLGPLYGEGLPRIC